MSVRRRLRRPPGILGAVFVPCDVVRQAAVAVADHEGLAEDRVKDAVKGFLPGPGPDAQRFCSSDSLIVDVAFSRFMVAISCSRRGAKIDADDIVLPCRQLGLTTAGEGLDLAGQAYPGRPVPGRSGSCLPRRALQQ